MRGATGSLCRLFACIAAIGLLPVAASADSFDVVNTATAIFGNPVTGVDTSIDSNTVGASVTIPPPDIEFYEDSSFTRHKTAARSGTPLYIQVLADGCEHDHNAVESFRITISSKGSGDMETYTAVETGKDTAIFRVMDSIVTRRITTGVMAQNGVLELWGEDALTADVQNCAGSDIDGLLIDPVGIVFDSKTNEPIAGATVHLIDVTGAGNGGFPGGDAIVFDFDGVTRAPSIVISDAEGNFQFPLVAPSEYRLLITPPGDYKFPSTRAPGDLVQTRIINLPGSFGGTFPVNETTGTVMLDVPLDTDETGLVVEKRAARPTAEIAETIQYSIDMRNQSGIDLLTLALRDDLPAGFSYVLGSAQVDGVKVADPQGGKGPALSFKVGPIASNAQSTLTYRVLVGPGALQGDGVNSAQLISSSPARKVSNVSKTTVKVEGGVFDDRAFVLGKIFADCNANGLQDQGEAGIPRVRLYMEDGSFVISDGNGAYSFYGVTPRTHVLKVDMSTLPNSATLAALSHRNAGSGSTRFLDVQRSEMHRADFATTGCNKALSDEIALRRDATAGLGRELDLGVKAELKTQEQAAAPIDARSLPASGIVGEPVGSRSTVDKFVAPVAPAAAVVTKQTLQSLLPRLDGQLDFVGIKDGDELGVTQATLRVKGKAQSTIELQVNDVIVPRGRVGLSLTDTARQIQALEFVGVNLDVGTNKLKLVQRDVGGNIREIREISVVAAGNAARIALSTSETGIPSDGEHAASIAVEVQDSHGVPVAARTAITLEASLGDWEVVDLDPNDPGVQTFIEGSQATYTLRSPLTVGTSIVRVTSGDFEATTRVSFVAALRPLLAAGVLEGTFNLAKLDSKSLQPARSEDGFEREITNWARTDSNDDSKSSGGARAALFLKGKVRGDYLLTLGYDSEKDTNERLFRDIQPDEFYPVYGDSSVKGFDAQSTGHLYVRVDRNKSYFLAGDITTQSLSQARMLGAYNRSLTGVKEHLETDLVTIDAFASHDTARQVVEELPANGTSGPFFLSNLNAIENSERIEILTRDRDQPAVIIQTQLQQRFTDYDVEPLTGRILFRGPIPSVDPNLNPISIRITYEVDQGGEQFWTAGVDSQVRVTEHIEIGAAVVDDRNPLDERRIGSVNTTVRMGDDTTLIGEVARTERALRDDGQGQRIELRHEGADFQMRAFGGRTDAAFDNPSASMSANRSEAGAKAGYSITETTRLVGEALHTADVTTDAQRNGALLGVEHTFAVDGFGNVKAELGARNVRDEPATRPATETTSVRTKVTAPLPYVQQASVFGEYEQDIEESQSRVIAAGGNYQLANRSRLYARHEFISSLGGPYQLDPTVQHNMTVFGIDTSYMENDRLFSEYRIADALSGREAQAAIGLRNGWQLARGIRANTSIERVDAISGGTSLGDTAAATAALEYTRNPLWKGTARLELRQSDNSDGILSTLGVAYKLSNDWTFLGKNVLATTDGKGTQPDREQDRLQFGFAYRDSETNRVNALARYEFKTEDGLELGLKRVVHIVSAHADFQASARTLWRAQYAGKLADETVDGMKLSNSAHLIGGRVTRDIGTRFDAGIHVRALFNGNFDGYQGGVGAEGGYLIHDNLWISVGYNVLGFRDQDLTAEEYTNQGAYLRLRFKFDESLLERL